MVFLRPWLMHSLQEDERCSKYNVLKSSYRNHLVKVWNFKGVWKLLNHKNDIHVRISIIVQSKTHGPNGSLIGTLLCLT